MNNKKAPGREERPALDHTKHNPSKSSPAILERIMINKAIVSIVHRCMVTPVQDLAVWTSGSISRSGTAPFVSWGIPSTPPVATDLICGPAPEKSAESMNGVQAGCLLAPGDCAQVCPESLSPGKSDDPSLDQRETASCNIKTPPCCWKIISLPLVKRQVM